MSFVLRQRVMECILIRFRGANFCDENWPSFMQSVNLKSLVNK